MITNIKNLIANDRTHEAIEMLLEYVAKIDSFFCDSIIVQKQRLTRIELENAKGIITHEEYLLVLNKISNALLYICQQIPEQQIQPSKVKKGKLLYDIPLQMPIELETRCIVRIADNKEALLLNYTKIANTIIEDIKISEVMNVELIDFNTDKCFDIRNFNSVEQVIDEGEASQWVFFVKPLKEGNQKLFLKISTIEIILGKERKKEIVLEKEIEIVAELASIPENRWAESNVWVYEISNQSDGFNFYKFTSYSFPIILGILFVGIICYFPYEFRGFSTDKEQLLFTENFSTLNSPLSQRRDDNSTLEQAMELYDKKEYKAANVKFDSFLATEPNNSGVSLYAGISHLAAGEADKAIPLLKKVIANDDNFIEVAQWYLALALLKNKDRKSAVIVLEEICNTPGHEWREDAKHLLRQLE